MKRTVTALFDEYDDAAKAVQRLEDAGISYREISIVSNAGGKSHTVPLGTTDDAVAGAGTGATVGAVLGGSAGLLAGLGLVAIPGLGPMLAAGWLAAAAAGATAGAASGGLVGLLMGAGVSSEDAQIYSEGLRRGGTLVVARIEPGKYEECRAILAGSGAVDIAERGKSYKEAGWRGSEEAAAPVAPAERAPDRSIGDSAQTPFHRLIDSARVEGTGVYDRNGTHIGIVKRLMIDKAAGRIAYVVMAGGSFLGVDEGAHIIPWDALTYDTHLQGYRMKATDDKVRGAAAYLP